MVFKEKFSVTSAVIVDIIFHLIEDQKGSLKSFLLSISRVGENTREDGSTFIWNELDIDALRFYAVETPKRENYFIFLQMGDEVLDYTVAKNHYDEAKMIIEEGGNHRFEKFERYFDQVSAFLST